MCVCVWERERERERERPDEQQRDVDAVHDAELEVHRREDVLHLAFEHLEHQLVPFVKIALETLKRLDLGVSKVDWTTTFDFVLKIARETLPAGGCPRLRRGMGRLTNGDGNVD